MPFNQTAIGPTLTAGSVGAPDYSLAITDRTSELPAVNLRGAVSRTDLDHIVLRCSTTNSAATFIWL